MDRYGIILGKKPPSLPEPVVVGAPMAFPPDSSSHTVDDFLTEFFSVNPHTAPTAPTTATLTAVRREDLLRESLRTARGRQLLATAMTEPMRLRLDSSSFARRAFLVDRLTSGTLPIYDANGISYAVDMTGEEVHQISWEGAPSRSVVPMFENPSYQFIPLSYLRNPGRLSLIERAQDLAVVEMSARETSAMMRVFDTVINAIPHNHSRNLRVSGGLATQDMADGFHTIEQNNLRVENLFMNTVEFSTIRRLMNQFEPSMSRQILATGMMGTLWGARVYVSSIFPAGRIYLTAEPEFVGRMPLRDLVVLSADDPLNLQVGFAMTENVGMCCSNLNGIACIVNL